MARLPLLLFCFGLAVADISTPLVGQNLSSCPDYTSYSYAVHDPRSGGKFRLPYQRPEPACRKFNLTEVEETITSMRDVIKDPDLFQLFQNCFPNTLDTAITWKGVANGTEDEEVSLWSISLSMVSYTVHWLSLGPPHTN